MTTVLEKQTVEVINNYSNGRYRTVKKNGMMYLVLADSSENEEVIASFTSDKTCKVFNKDLAHCWLSENTNEHRKLERLSDEQLQGVLTYWLSKDLDDLMVLDKLEFSENFNNIFNRFTPDLQEKILDGLEKLEVYKDGKLIVPYAQLVTANQMEWASRKLYPFIKLSADQGHYDICKRTVDGGYIIIAKNGGCGTFRKLEKDKANKIVLIFDKPVKPVVQLFDISNQIKKDLKGTSYQAANNFVKMEEKLCKAYDILIEEVTKKQGFIDSSSLCYPDLDEETSTIASMVRKIQKSEEPEKSYQISELAKIYDKAYTKLQKSKLVLEELYKQYGI